MTIRTMTLADAANVSRLSAQLGYPVSEETTRGRIERIIAQSEHAAFVAEDVGQVVGWIHMYVSHILESENSFTEIAGLVVDESLRGKGIGRSLVLAAEDWTRKMGLDDIRLRSAVKRSDAHEFYKRLGYEIVKTQFRFAKKLEERG